MTDKIRLWIADNAVRLVVYAVVLTVAFVSLRAEVAQKADRSTVEAMASDVRAIKTLVCRAYPNDSACLPEPGRR